MPNPSRVSPEAGLATAAKLKPHKALRPMDGVSRSGDRTVDDKRKSLASAAPSMDRPRARTSSKNSGQQGWTS